MSIATIRGLLKHFVASNRLTLIPLVIVLLVAAVLLLLTTGLSYVAPFVYALF